MAEYLVKVIRCQTVIIISAQSIAKIVPKAVNKKCAILISMQILICSQQCNIFVQTRLFFAGLVTNIKCGLLIATLQEDGTAGNREEGALQG